MFKYEFHLVLLSCLGLTNIWFSYFSTIYLNYFIRLGEYLKYEDNYLILMDSESISFSARVAIIELCIVWRMHIKWWVDKK